MTCASARPRQGPPRRPEMDLFGRLPTGGGGAQFLTRILGCESSTQFMLDAKRSIRPGRRRWVSSTGCARGEVPARRWSSPARWRRRPAARGRVRQARRLPRRRATARHAMVLDSASHGTTCAGASSCLVWKLRARYASGASVEGAAIVGAGLTTFGRFLDRWLSDSLAMRWRRRCYAGSSPARSRWHSWRTRWRWLLLVKSRLSGRRFCAPRRSSSRSTTSITPVRPRRAQ